MTRRVGDPVRPRATWATLLASPVVATTWFMLVYLSAEAACAHGVEDFGRNALRWLIVGLTAVSVALLTAAGLSSLRVGGRAAADEDPDVEASSMRRFLGSTGLILGGLFGFFTLLVAAPVIGSTLC